MNEQLKKKIKKKVKPINEWIDEVAERQGPKAGKMLALFVTIEVGKKMSQYEKKEQLRDIDNIN